jgi:hypothetical protein
VYEDAEGRQYVVDLNGECVYGQWLPPADEPDVVEDGGLNRIISAERRL